MNENFLNTIEVHNITLGDFLNCILICLRYFFFISVPCNVIYIERTLTHIINISTMLFFYNSTVMEIFFVVVLYETVIIGIMCL